MLFMVVEKFRAGNPAEVGARFESEGRLLPEGVAYIASWMTVDGRECYQLMEADSRESLDAWMARWQDLVEFEIKPVLASADYWKK